MSSERPVGIIILAILMVLGGISWLGAASAAFMGAGAAAMVPVVGFLAGGLLVVIGVVAVLLGILSFFVAYGLWVGRGWAWSIAILLSILAIIIGVLSLPGGIINIIIGIIVVYYLTRPHVKAYFGKT